MGFLGSASEGEEGDDAHGIANLAGGGHLDGFGEGESANGDLFGVFGLRGFLGETAGDEEVGGFIADGIGELDIEEEGFKMGGDEAGFFEEFAAGAVFEGLALGATAFGDFPFVAVVGVAVLADEPGVAFIIDGDNADGAVAVFDDPVDAWGAVGFQDLIFANADPGIEVDLA